MGRVTVEQIVEMVMTNPSLGRICYSEGQGEDAWTIDVERAAVESDAGDPYPAPMIVPSDASDTGGGVDTAPASEWDDPDMWAASGQRPVIPEGA